MSLFQNAYWEKIIQSTFENAYWEKIIRTCKPGVCGWFEMFSTFQMFTAIEKLLQIFQVKFHHKYVGKIKNVQTFNIKKHLIRTTSLRQRPFDNQGGVGFCISNKIFFFRHPHQILFFFVHACVKIFFFSWWRPKIIFSPATNFKLFFLQNLALASFSIYHHLSMVTSITTKLDSTIQIGKPIN